MPPLRLLCLWSAMAFFKDRYCLYRCGFLVGRDACLRLPTFTTSTWRGLCLVALLRHAPLFSWRVLPAHLLLSVRRAVSAAGRGLGRFAGRTGVDVAGATTSYAGFCLLFLHTSRPRVATCHLPVPPSFTTCVRTLQTLAGIFRLLFLLLPSSFMRLRRVACLYSSFSCRCHGSFLMPVLRLGFQQRGTLLRHASLCCLVSLSRSQVFIAGPLWDGLQCLSSHVGLVDRYMCLFWLNGRGWRVITAISSRFHLRDGFVNSGVGWDLVRCAIWRVLASLRTVLRHIVHYMPFLFNTAPATTLISFFSALTFLDNAPLYRRCGERLLVLSFRCRCCGRRNAGSRAGADAVPDGGKHAALTLFSGFPGDIFAVCVVFETLSAALLCSFFKTC